MEALTFLGGEGGEVDFIKRIEFVNSSKTTKDFYFSGEWSLMVPKAILLLGGIESLHFLTLVLLPIAHCWQASLLPHGTLAWSLSDKAGPWQQQEEKGKRNKRIQRKEKIDLNITQQKSFVVVCFGVFL